MLQTTAPPATFLTNFSDYGPPSFDHRTDNACVALLDQIENLRDPFSDRRIRTVVIILYIVISLFGAMGNFLVIFAVLRNPAMRTPRNFVVINLASSDFIMCTITVPFTMVYLLDLFWQLGDAMCRIVASLQGINVFVSTLSITAISLDRYLLIIFPTNPNLHRFVPVTCFVAVWIWSILMAMPMFFATSVVYPLNGLPLASHCDIMNKYPMCREDFGGKSFRIGYTLACFAFQYLLPLTTLAVAYMFISLRLRKRLMFRGGNTMQAQQRRREEEQRQSRTNTLIVLIVAIFATVWLPLNIYITLVTFDGSVDMPEAFAFCHMFGMISSCANPILYGVLNENFRKEFTTILGIAKIRSFLSGERSLTKHRIQQSALLNNHNQLPPDGTNNYPSCPAGSNDTGPASFVDPDERTPLRKPENSSSAADLMCLYRKPTGTPMGTSPDPSAYELDDDEIPPPTHSTTTYLLCGESYVI